MAPLTQQLFSSPVGLSQLDPPVRERIAIPLCSNKDAASGGDDGAIIFPTGGEIYVFDSNSIRGFVKPRAITAAWIDATNLAAGKTLTVQCSNGQKFILQNTTAAAFQGPQGYFIIPLPAPFKITVSTNNAAALTVTIILYNYNVAFTGLQTGASVSVAGTGGASGGGSGSGGGSTGGSGGGGFRGCPIVGTSLEVFGNGTFENESFENENWIEIELEGIAKTDVGALRLSATPSHVVYTVEGGNKTLHEVEVGDHVLTNNGEREVVSKTYYKEKSTAIRVHVEGSHMYFANGILSHNKA